METTGINTLKKNGITIPLILILFTAVASGQSINVQKIKKIRLKMYPAEGLVWKGQSAQNTNWNKITETPDGKIWFCGGDHWGTDGVPGGWDQSERYERPWGFGNTAICYYDPETDKVFLRWSLTGQVLFIPMQKLRDMVKSMAILPQIQKDFYISADIWDLLTCMNTLVPIIRKAMSVERLSNMILLQKILIIMVFLFHMVPQWVYIMMKRRNTVYGITPDRAKFWRVNLTTMELNRYESLARMSRLE